MGFADVENQVAMTPDHRLRIASISKPMSVTAAALLWEQGKLDLDAPVQVYLPDFLPPPYVPPSTDTSGSNSNNNKNNNHNNSNNNK